MGCDIHVHTEIDLGQGWEHYSVPHVRRNYVLFTHMGMTHRIDDIEPVTPLRGIPGNVTNITRADFEGWGEDAHSASWFGLDEIVRLEDLWRDGVIPIYDKRTPWIESEFGYLFGNGWGDLKRWPDEPGRVKVSDVRWIFWFDN